MTDIIKKIKSNYSILKNILDLINKKINIIFYSEDKSYQKVSYTLIEFFANKYPGQVYYASSCEQGSRGESRGGSGYTLGWRGRPSGYTFFEGGGGGQTFS